MVGAGAGNTLKENILRLGLNWRFGMQVFLRTKNKPVVLLRKITDTTQQWTAC